MGNVVARGVDTTQPVKAVPWLTIADRGTQAAHLEPEGGHGFRYRAREHCKLPHVMKFSGGRSSGMLLFTLLENGLPQCRARRRGGVQQHVLRTPRDLPVRGDLQADRRATLRCAVLLGRVSDLTRTRGAASGRASQATAW